MTKLKGETDAAKIFEPGIRAFGIHQQAFGQLSLWFVMIQHNYIDPSFPEPSDFDSRRCPAIDSDEKLRIVLAKTSRDSLRAQTVAFLDSKRQEQCGFAAVPAQHFGQQRQRGNAVDVVVAEQNDALPLINGVENSFHCILHSG